MSDDLPELDELANLPKPPPISPELDAELAKLEPVATRRPWRQLAIVLAIALAYAGGMLAVLTIRRDLDELPMGWLFMAGIAWLILQQVIIRSQGEGSKLKAAVGRDLKGKASGLLYAAAIPLAFVHPIIADAIFVGVAGMWLVPDRRMAAHVTE